MKIRRVLVVYKKSSFDLYSRRKDPHFIRAIRTGHATISRILPTHIAHQEALTKVRSILKKLHIQAKYSYRSNRFDDRPFDLVLTVGGDGTFLETSHRVISKPMLGVNSCPTDSVGIFCGATAQNLERTLKKIITGKMKPIAITRLNAKLNSRPLSLPILNDILVSHINPAATSRYFLEFHRYREEHKSSGLWISTPAGSTAAVGSAGGRFMSIAGRSFQYFARELYRRPGFRYPMQSGVIPHSRKLSVISKMRVGRIFLDGPHRVIPFPIGSKLEVSARAPVLKVYAFNEKRRRSFR